MAKTSKALDNLLAKAGAFGSPLDVNIFVKSVDDPLVSAFADSEPVIPSKERVSEVKARRLKEQEPLLNFCDSLKNKALGFTDGISQPLLSSVDQFWINNSISMRVIPNVLREILSRDDIEHVDLNHYADLSELMDIVAPEDLVTLDQADVDANSEIAWSVNRVNAPLLWNAGLRGDGVVVAVIDTGVNYKHPDLENNMWTHPQYPLHGYDFENNDGDPIDGGSHGTSCAGIVAGDGTSGTRTGIAPKAKIIAIRVGGDERTFWRGMQFAIERGVHVISMSMTWKFPNNPNYPGWRRICETIAAAGILHANSIGNQGDDLATYPIPFNIATPGNCPPPRLHRAQNPTGGTSSVISCGATDSADRLANYSGRGPAAWSSAPYSDYPYPGSALIKPDICAPGPGTKSCNWRYKIDEGAKPYTEFGGTSSATPHVAGCLALLANACLLANKPIDPKQIQEAIEETAVRVVGQTQAKENHFGAGRIDVYNAYRYGRNKNWW